MNDAKSDAAKRLKDARQAAKDGFFKHAVDAARFYGWKEGTYRSHESGARNYTKDEAETYGRAFGVTAGWLLFAEGIKPASQNLHKRPTIASLPLPLLRWSDFGAKMVDLAKVIEGTSKYIEVPAVVAWSKFAFTLQAEDDSMVQNPINPSLRPEENFPKGTNLSFEPAADVNPGDYVWAHVAGKGHFFRKYRHIGFDEAGKDIVELAPLNSNFPILKGIKNETIFPIGRLMLDFRKH